MNIKDFNYWKERFEQNDMFTFNSNVDGLLWLKTRAVIRKEILSKFLSFVDINITSTKRTEQFKELFSLLSKDIPTSLQKLDDFLRDETNELYQQKGVDEEQLKSDLYKITKYHWGGDYNNSLDRYLVSRYVKSISSYTLLRQKFPEIGINAQEYVTVSWYNNWSSYLIEQIFKRHPSVVSAVGEIKNVDFFIGQIPIDLKVTFLPNEYQKSIRKKLGIPTDVQYLKGVAKELNISYDSKALDTEILYELYEKMNGCSECCSIIATFRQNRLKVLEEVKKDTYVLMQWLYEQQGGMRFGAENRLFIVLVDSQHWEDSWKLKRDFTLLEKNINLYLDTFSESNMRTISFTHSGRKYQALADILFIIK